MDALPGLWGLVGTVFRGAEFGQVGEYLKITPYYVSQFSTRLPPLYKNLYITKQKTINTCIEYILILYLGVSLLL